MKMAYVHFRTFETFLTCPLHHILSTSNYAAAFKAYGVPWDRPPTVHPLLGWVKQSDNLRGRVSLIYNALLHKSAGRWVDDTDCELTIIQQRILMAGFTAAKKVTFQLWIHLVNFGLAI